MVVFSAWNIKCNSCTLKCTFLDFIQLLWSKWSVTLFLIKRIQIYICFNFADNFFLSALNQKCHKFRVSAGTKTLTTPILQLVSKHLFNYVCLFNCTLRMFKVWFCLSRRKQSFTILFFHLHVFIFQPNNELEDKSKTLLCCFFFQKRYCCGNVDIVRSATYQVALWCSCKVQCMYH